MPKSTVQTKRCRDPKQKNSFLRWHQRPRYKADGTTERRGYTPGNGA
nr:MAG TPA: hypothetical protein [Caudoviricetes sp.]